MDDQEIATFVSCFLKNEFGQKNFEDYLTDLLKRRETRVTNHRRWRALCKEEKTNFKSIFNENKHRMTVNHKAQLKVPREIEQSRSNLDQMLSHEDQKVEHALCFPEGFILSGLPEQLDVLLALEKEFMEFTFEDQRLRTEHDCVLEELELCFGRKLRKESQKPRRSFFDLVVVVRSHFENLIRTRLGKFEVPGGGREVDLYFMTSADKEFVAEFVPKVRVNDNVYALPSKFHQNLKAIEKVVDMYRKNFTSNGNLAQANPISKPPELVMVIDDEEDLARSIRRLEECLNKVLARKEALYQGLYSATERRDEREGLQTARNTKRDNYLSQKSSVQDAEVKLLTTDFFREIQSLQVSNILPKRNLNKRNWQSEGGAAAPAERPKHVVAEVSDDLRELPRKSFS